MSKIGTKIPTVTFKTRVRDESVGGDNPFRWQDVTTDDIFAGRKVVVFSHLHVQPCRYLVTSAMHKNSMTKA